MKIWFPILAVQAAVQAIKATLRVKQSQLVAAMGLKGTPGVLLAGPGWQRDLICGSWQHVDGQPQPWTALEVEVRKPSSRRKFVIWPAMVGRVIHEVLHRRMTETFATAKRLNIPSLLAGWDYRAFKMLG
jgi:hypothetical protein